MHTPGSRLTGARRYDPPWWDHQRHPLVGLRRGITALLDHPSVARRGGRVVDLGCGDRPYELLIRGRGFEYIGCDLDDHGDVLIVPGAPVPLPTGSASGVLSCQVLEHVWDLDWYLGECHRLLEPGGWLLLSTHGTWPYHPHPSDYRRWTRDGLASELQTRGFRLATINGVIGPLAWTTQIRALGFRQVLMTISPLRLLVPPIMMAMNLRMLLEDAMTPRSIVEVNACIYVTLCVRG
jgi:SAM-dependent methyltransferase